MDHIINFIIEYMQADKEDFINEWQTGKYKKISECPTYPYVKAYCDAITILNRLDGRYSGIAPSSFIMVNK